MATGEKQQTLIQSILSFVGEAFFLTQYAFHVGFVPALRQWRTQMGMFRHTMTAAGGNSHEANVNLYRIEQSYIALLFPPSLLQGAILFMRLQAAWLDGLLKRPPAEARAALEAVPEWVVHDLCYFVDVVIALYPEDLALQPLTPFVLALAGVLRAGSAALGQGGGGRLIRSPLVLAKVVKLLHDLVVPPNKRRKESSWGGGNATARLSESVLGHEQVRTALPLPLIGVYAAVSAVEGLDADAVEAEGFNKYGTRDDTNALLLQLWQIADGRAAICAIVDQAEGEGGAKLARANDLFISMYNMGRSPQLWEDPDVFDPQRWDRPFTNPEVKGWAGYDPDKRTGINIEQGGLWVANLEIATDHAMLPFGAGARKCVGDQFALLEAAVSVVMLLRRFEFELSMDPVYPEKFDDNNPDKSIGMVGMKAAATIHTATGLFCKVKERFPGETDLPPLQAPVREKKKRAADEPQEVLV